MTDPSDSYQRISSIPDIIHQLPSAFDRIEWCELGVENNSTFNQIFVLLTSQYVTFGEA
jgi:hypothetical protein